MNKKLSPIHVIRASAGTGKTFRLASEYSKHLASSNTSCPSNVIATTFTKKAASELVHRIRKFLLKEGCWHQAQALLAAPIGTVNSVCGRLVADLAVEAGLSPSVKVIAEERQTEIFNMAVEEVLNAYAHDLGPLIYRMGKRDDWREDVIRIVDIARQNDIEADTLRSFAATSWLSFKALLPDKAGGISTSDFYKLRSEIKSALSCLPVEGDVTKVTVSAIEDLQNIGRTWDSMKDISWDFVAKLCKLKAGKKSQPQLENLIEMAQAHIWHAAFLDDVEKFIDGIYTCASDCLAVYQDFKAERAMLDFIDQEQLALSILRNPSNLPALDGRFNALLIDEFQDTSPIQLAVFLELASLVDKSIWVGDEKQSIFGFRGSDPLLMQAVIDELVPHTAGARENLAKSYRSRPNLVSFVNSVFGEALQPFGFALSDIEINQTNRTEDSKMNSPVHLWWLGAGSKSDSMRVLANEVFEILSHPEKWPVCSHSGSDIRNIKGSDIAILCQTNANRLEIADALSALGIVVSTERTGLLSTPECVLSIAVLRFLSDLYDTLALAEILRYTDASDDDRKWLFDWLESGCEAVVAANEDLQSLLDLRRELLGLTPVESLQLATTAPLVLATILRWGNHRQRLLNLDALLGVATTYEESCVANRETASTAGLIAYFGTAGDPQQSANPDDQAVHVLTYHKSKGLEWPMVVMFDLQTPRPANPFGSHVATVGTGLNAHNPLDGRSVRYWPWPYGKQTADLELVTAASRSPEMTEALHQRDAEFLRLLYVGMTRPRDYLVLACSEKTGGTGWLDIAKNSRGETVFMLSPGSAGTLGILRHSPDQLAVCSILPPVDLSSRATLHSTEDRYEFLVPKSKLESAISYSCAPSSLHFSAEISMTAVEVEKQINLGARLALGEVTDMRSLGEAMHQFFAIDDFDIDKTERLRRAASIAESHKILGLNPTQFLEASDRLKTALEELYPEAVWLREWAVTGKYGKQRMTGAIDLLLELSEGYVIVDHKSFPGPYELWAEKATSHYPQLDAYSQLVRQATTKNVVACYIHMPIVGALLKMKAANYAVADQLPSADEEAWLIL